LYSKSDWLLTKNIYTTFTYIYCIFTKLKVKISKR
jgi:hypothetical protein